MMMLSGWPLHARALRVLPVPHRHDRLVLRPRRHLQLLSRQEVEMTNPSYLAASPTSSSSKTSSPASSVCHGCSSVGRQPRCRGRRRRRAPGRCTGARRRPKTPNLAAAEPPGGGGAAESSGRPGPGETMSAVHASAPSSATVFSSFAARLAPEVAEVLLVQRAVVGVGQGAARRVTGGEDTERRESPSGTKTKHSCVAGVVAARCRCVDNGGRVRTDRGARSRGEGGRGGSSSGRVAVRGRTWLRLYVKLS